MIFDLAALPRVEHSPRAQKRRKAVILGTTVTVLVASAHLGWPLYLILQEGVGLDVIIAGAWGFLPAAALFWLLRILATRRQRVILHLRSFGETDQAVIRALSLGLARRFRVVTLDDGTLPPLRTPVGDLIAIIGRVPLMFFTITAVLGLIIVLLGASPDGEMAALYFLVPFWLASAGGTVVLLLVRLALATRRQYVRIDGPGTLQRIDRLVANLGGRRWPANHVLPRLVVARTIDALWQALVERAATQSDGILIDVSRNTAGLAWELQHIASKYESRVVYIARADTFAATAASPALPPSVRGQVLQYGSSASWREARAFGENLSRAFENCIAELPRRRGGVIQEIASRSTIALLGFIGFVLPLILILLAAFQRE